MASSAEHAFYEWLSVEGLLLNGCSLGKNPAGGTDLVTVEGANSWSNLCKPRAICAAVRGLIADVPLPAGRVVVSVPDEAVLMPSTSR